jgi:RND family efflux transporter MFP subunit
MRNALPRVLVTAAVVALAVAAGWLLWQTYLLSPWTRDGRVRANVVQIAPDVGGVITEVRIKDNQAVGKGDVLMVVDPERYRLAVAQAEAGLRGRASELDQRRRELARRNELTSSAISNETREQAATAFRAAQAAYDQAQAQLDAAKLNLARSEVRSTVNGYVTNLLVQAGEYAQPGRATVAVVDGDSFYVAAYFEETQLRHIHEGDPVSIRLMSAGTPLAGHVDSIARAIADRENTAGSDLIANVNPTFSWVRLAQRIPVRCTIDRLPDGVRLTSGMTATVVVESGATAGKGT